MSDESRATPDISRVIGVLMENPEILEKISALVKGDDKAPEVPAPPTEEKNAAIPTYTEAVLKGVKHSRRAQLLGALKPYVKSERAQAIDSVIAIADILDMMRGK